MSKLSCVDLQIPFFLHHKKTKLLDLYHVYTIHFLVPIIFGSPPTVHLVAEFCSSCLDVLVSESHSNLYNLQSYSRGLETISITVFQFSIFNSSLFTCTDMGKGTKIENNKMNGEHLLAFNQIIIVIIVVGSARLYVWLRRIECFYLHNQGKMERK
jgi:hypothetical protein